MPESPPIHIVELCRRIGRFHEAAESRFQEMPDDELTAALDNEDEQQKNDFLNAVTAKLSELTGLRREDVAEFIHRSAHGGNWSEWKRAGGSAWPDISDAAQKLIACDENGRTLEFIRWLSETYPDVAKILEVGCTPQADPKAPYMPVDWFKDEFGLTAEMLRGQVRAGNLAVKKRNRWNLYSVPDAQEIWPHVVTYGPDGTR